MRYVQPISNSSDVRNKLSQIIHTSIEDDRLINIMIVKQEGWVAVPIDCYSHVTAMNEEQLQRVFLSCGYTELSAMSLDLMGEHPSTFTIPTTVEGIEEFNREIGHFYYALFAGEPDWIILHTVIDFDVVVGPSDFVCQLLGCELEEAFSRFQSFVKNYPASTHTMKMKENLQFVHDHFRDDYPVAEIGSDFCLIKPQSTVR